MMRARTGSSVGQAVSLGLGVLLLATGTLTALAAGEDPAAGDQAFVNPLDCPPEDNLVGSMGWAGLSDPKPTKSKALADYVPRVLPNDADVTDFRSIGSTPGRDTFLSSDHQVLVVVQQDDGMWHAESSLICESKLKAASRGDSR